MKILIATGVFPPEIGGPAQYARNLFDEFGWAGHEVFVARYTIERKLPIGVRHLVFFLKAFFRLLTADFAIALDTFSVGVPTILAARLLRKKVVVRIAGDFLWESYVERTGSLITLRRFYESMPRLSLKEKVIFLLSRKILGKAHALVFTTKWQRDIWSSPYSVASDKTAVIENYFSRKEGKSPTKKNFVWPVRPLKLKNGRLLYRAFAEARKKDPHLVLDDGRYPYDETLRRIESCYAVILPSISDVSPNAIIDAITYGKPFIMTRESGYAGKLKSIGLLVDPLDEKDITDKITLLADKETYNLYKSKVENFSYTHSYREIASDYLKLFHSL